MNARQQAPYFSATYPADKLHGDEGISEYTADEECRIEFAAGVVVDERVKSAEWWNGVLEGVNGTTSELPQQLARMMANLDRACEGDGISLGAITAALSIVQRQAKRDAEDGARDEAERMLTEGEI